MNPILRKHVNQRGWAVNPCQPPSWDKTCALTPSWDNLPKWAQIHFINPSSGLGSPADWPVARLRHIHIPDAYEMWGHLWGPPMRLQWPWDCEVKRMTTVVTYWSAILWPFWPVSALMIDWPQLTTTQPHWHMSLWIISVNSWNAAEISPNICYCFKNT